MAVKFNPLTGKFDLSGVSGAGPGHDPVTVTDSSEIDFTLTGQNITASIVSASIDETKLDASVNASLDLADTASQPGHTHTASDITDFDTEVSNNSAVSLNTAKISADGSINTHSDVDTSTTPPSLNQVLKWNGTNWVPGIAGDTDEFTFSIDSFSDSISDTTQLIGSGTWQAIGALTFTATYSNAPVGMTAQVALSGSAVSWASALQMTPVTGPETNTEAVSYPSTQGSTITFTLSQSASASTSTQSVTFNNTMRYGNSSFSQGNQTEASLEALTEVDGPNESRSQTINNIASTANYLVFAYADRLSDIGQVLANDGGGFITASFNSTRTTVAPLVQTSVANVTNSAGYSETFACITSTDTGLANSTNDFQITTSTTPTNYLWYGKTTKTSGYTESDIESLANKFASNDHTRSDWVTVTLGSGEYYLIALPTRLGTPVFKDEDTGFAFSFQTAEVVAVTNWCGFTENYNVWRSTNSNLGASNLLTE